MRIAQTTSLAALVGAVACPAQALEVPFLGTVTASCILLVGTPGVLAANTDGTVLSSDGGSGVSGTISAVATGLGYSVSVESPNGFLAPPPGGNTDVTFASTYTGIGATTIAKTDEETASPINVGITSLGVDLTATKSSGIFPAGAYATSVTVTCD